MSFFASSDNDKKNDEVESSLENEIKETIEEVVEESLEKAEEKCCEEVKEMENYTNDKGEQVLNRSLASVVDMFDKANKNVIIHKLKVSVGAEEEVENEKLEIMQAEFAKLSAKMEALESSNRENLAKISELSSATKESVESSLLATKQELVGNLRDVAENSGSGSFGYILTAIFAVAATSAFFLKDNILAMLG